MEHFCRRICRSFKAPLREVVWLEVPGASQGEKGEGARALLFYNQVQCKKTILKSKGHYSHKIRCIAQLAQMSIDPKFIELTADVFGQKKKIKMLL